MTEITDYLFRAYDLAWVPFNKVLDSAFLSAVFGSLAGAYFGARAAQELAARKQDKDELTRHIKATAYAITLSTALVQFFAGAKKQQVMCIAQRYKELREAYDKVKARKAVAGDPRPVLDMSVMSIATAPVDVMRTQLVEKIQVRHARPIRVQMALEQSAEGLNELLHKRNQWIEDFKANPLTPEQLPAKLFGLAENGVIDMSYPGLIQALTEHCDDALFFSHLLCRDLQAHGLDLRNQYIKNYGKPAPGTPTVDFSEMIAEGLIPPDSLYQSWFTGFVEAPPYRNKRQRAFDWVKEVFVPTKV